MYSETAEYYDEIYSFLDYAESTRHLLEVIEPRTNGKRLLDIACGTGKHLTEFKNAGYEVEGVDLDPNMVRIALERNPGVTVQEADMCEFSLGHKFDVITNLFSSIGYACTTERLGAAVSAMAAHLADGGVAVVEPWLSKEVYVPGKVHLLTVDKPDLKICRMSYSGIDDMLSVIEFHYLFASANEGVTEAKEIHTTAMFTVDDFAEAATAAGLSHEFLEGEQFRRGLHIFQ